MSESPFKVLRDPDAAVKFAEEQTKLLNKIRSNIQGESSMKELFSEEAVKQALPITQLLQQQIPLLESAVTGFIPQTEGEKRLEIPKKKNAYAEILDTINAGQELNRAQIKKVRIAVNEVRGVQPKGAIIAPGTLPPMSLAEIADTLKNVQKYSEVSVDKQQEMKELLDIISSKASASSLPPTDLDITYGVLPSVPKGTTGSKIIPRIDPRTGKNAQFGLIFGTKDTTPKYIDILALTRSDSLDIYEKDGDKLIGIDSILLSPDAKSFILSDYNDIKGKVKLPSDDVTKLIDFYEKTAKVGAKDFKLRDLKAAAGKATLKKGEVSKIDIIPKPSTPSSKIPASKTSSSLPVTGFGLYTLGNPGRKVDYRIRGGRLGVSYVDIPKLQKLHLQLRKKQSGGKILFDLPKISNEVLEMITSKINPTKKYAMESIETVRNVLAKAGIDINSLSKGVRKVLSKGLEDVADIIKGDGFMGMSQSAPKLGSSGLQRMGGGCVPMMFSGPNQVIERCNLLSAAIKAGNTSPMIKNEMSALLDLLRKDGIIDQKKYSESMKKYVNY